MSELDDKDETFKSHTERLIKIAKERVDEEVVVLEHGKIYECSFFDEDMNGCSIRLKAVTRKGELVLKELDCSKVHKKTEFYYIELADDQSPYYHRTYTDK